MTYQEALVRQAATDIRNEVTETGRHRIVLVQIGNRLVFGWGIGCYVDQRFHLLQLTGFGDDDTAIGVTNQNDGSR